MKILFDTNVVLDVMLDRTPFSSIASLLFSKVETGEIKGFKQAAIRIYSPKELLKMLTAIK